MYNEVANLENEKVVLVSINSSYENLINHTPFKGKERLIDCVHKFWPVTPERANKAEFVFGIYKNEIMAVAKIIKPWKRVFDYMQEGYFTEDEEPKRDLSLISRCAFIGKLVENSPYLGKKLSANDKLSGPSRYINC